MPSKKPDAKVSCLCGFQVRVDPLSGNRQVTCPSCGSTFDYVVTIDQASHAPRLSLILPRGALKPEGESLALVPSARPSEPEPEPEPAQEPVAEFVEEPEAPPEPPPPPPKSVTRISKKGAGKTIKGVIARCECGQDFPVEDNGELTSVQSCPVCDRAYHVVFKLSGGIKSAIIVPTKPIVHRSSEKLRTVLAKPPPAKGNTKVRGNTQESTTTDFFGAGKKGRTRVTKISRNTTVQPKPKAPKEIPPGAQAAECPCGDKFIVRRKDVGQVLTCDSCGTKYRAAEVRDPQTLAPVIRMRPV
jgi:hypothetical protein